MDVDSILKILQLPWYLLLTLAFGYLLWSARRDCLAQIEYLKQQLALHEKRLGDVETISSETK